jgi:hypothetical protein
MVKLGSMPVGVRKKRTPAKPKVEAIPIDEFREWIVVLGNLLEIQKVNLDRTILASEPFLESPFTKEELQKIKNKIFVLSKWIQDDKV